VLARVRDARVTAHTVLPQWRMNDSSRSSTPVRTECPLKVFVIMDSGMARLLTSALCQVAAGCLQHSVAAPRIADLESVVKIQLIWIFRPRLTGALPL
jgi:hypothetical protein